MGSHDTYAVVPFGTTLRHGSRSGRSMCHRLLPFSFGLLRVYRLRERFMRVARARGVGAYWFPLERVLAFAAACEILEWRVADRVDPADRGAASTAPRYGVQQRPPRRPENRVRRKPLGEAALRASLKRNRKDR